MKNRIILIFTFLFLLLSAVGGFSVANATIRYVSHEGSSTPPYTTWETAADSIQKCIDYCVDGDTVIVANGIYNESIYINKTINLWGSSADSTIINGVDTPDIYIVYFFENNSFMKNFKLTSPGYDKIGIRTRYSNLQAENCIIENVSPLPLSINFSSVKIFNCIIRVLVRGIRDECPADTCHSVYSNNIIIAENNLETPVLFAFGGTATFTNNIVLGKGSLRGVDAQYQKGTVIKNNLVVGTSGVNIRAGQIRIDTAYIENNVSQISGNGYHTSSANLTKITNNIAKDVETGINTLNGAITPDYNLFWNVEQLFSGTAITGDSNVVANPMFVKDTVPTTEMNFDYHLQAYSPGIDNGNPDILDVDGTRSDIGMFGGPLGERYTYQDLAPRPPVNLTAVADTNQILLKWNRNSEADTSHYNVYRDTTTNFIIDSTKLISSPIDTFFIDSNLPIANKIVYKITAVDNQGNESSPSDEIVINTVSVTTNDPMTINDYELYQNYPNPFNPSTKIDYRLKEPGYVKLMVYDITGSLVSVLVNKEQGAGYYEVDFNVRRQTPARRSSSGGGSNVKVDLASGIYLYRIEVIGEGNIPVFSDMKKMILIK